MVSLISHHENDHFLLDLLSHVLKPPKPEALVEVVRDNINCRSNHANHPIKYFRLPHLYDDHSIKPMGWTLGVGGVAFITCVSRV